ncbi:MAG: KdsC family phosphatase [Hyphomicrobiales bacterium]
MPDILTPHPDLSRVCLLSCDIDGVLTDGGLYYADDETRLARFNVLDGMGLKRIQKAGVKVAFISQSTTSYIRSRAEDLGVDYCYTGIEDKLKVMKALLEYEPFGLEDVCHIGDDVNDLELLGAVGLAMTVPGCVPEVEAVCRFTTRQPGGNGAVRELCDAIIAAKRGVNCD